MAMRGRRRHGRGRRRRRVEVARVDAGARAALSTTRGGRAWSRTRPGGAVAVTDELEAEEDGGSGADQRKEDSGGGGKIRQPDGVVGITTPILYLQSM